MIQNKQKFKSYRTKKFKKISIYKRLIWTIFRFFKPIFFTFRPMRKQCLFDPNHLIDEYGYAKHLLNCQSKLKKDWRKCKYDDTHWFLYSYIDFHEKYECPMNPLYEKDPKQFMMRRDEWLRQMFIQANRKNVPKQEMILNELKDDLGMMNFTQGTKGQNQTLQMHFGEISMIQQSESPSNQIINQSHSIINSQIYHFHNALDKSLSSMEQKHLPQKNQPSQSQNNNDSQIQNKEYQSFQKGLALVKQKQLWTQPDFAIFEKKFRLKWEEKIQEKKSNQSDKQSEQEEFEEELEIIIGKKLSETSSEEELSISQIKAKYDEIDQD